ncbi:autotransporter outer membrane beta-barrel domain-containing protein [Snodgrassella sp. B3882]|uniref:autotransporter outer membrane beta-barrel domain-containing protein n=1 Tax=Snodgrassella sp. B3882 TaxID=2818037 RepID=UPI00226A6D91|nr:autotransporter outer membrane beta-barrel domain-containing protein [Snodgrassella sp. B3882]MCX8744142.1 autotransporter outer membrane beta-barrel domain-containing protein [Snodgrassella sp. B3882]
MNKIYKIIWNSVKRQWIVTSELANRGKTKSLKLIAVATLTSLSAYSMATCNISNSQVSVDNSGNTACSIQSGTYERGSATNDVITVKDKGIAVVNGNLQVKNTGQYHAIVVGTPYSNRDGGQLTINGDLNIDSDARINVDDNRTNARPSGLLIGDLSQVTIKGNVNIVHMENEEGGGVGKKYASGAPIRVWNKIAGNSSLIVEGETRLKSNGDGIRNGEEHNTLSQMKGGNLTFNKKVDIDVVFVGLKNNAGKVTFKDDTNIFAADGISIVQTHANGKILAEKDLTLTSRGVHNAIDIYGGKIDAQKKTTISTEGSGTTHGVTSSAVFITDGEITFGEELIATTNGTSTAINLFGNGDVFQLEGGTIHLAQKNTLTAENNGHGIFMTDGEVTSNNVNSLDIKVNKGKAIFVKGGDLSIKNTTISKVDSGQAIELAGGRFSTHGYLQFEQSSADTAAIHSTVVSNQTAEFINTGSLNISNLSDMTDIINHEGSGTLDVYNSGNLITTKGKALANTSNGSIIALNEGGVISGQIDAGNGIINLENLNYGSYIGRWENTGKSILNNLTNEGIIEFKHHPAVTRASNNFDTIEVKGDYIGRNNATLKMHTVWNHPGDIDGTNSYSDQFIIQGTASGQTTVIPVAADGTENKIDGDVQQLKTQINTIPVVKVGHSGTDRAFIGTAHTTGVAEVQLAKRTTAGADEYFWSITASNDDGGGSGGGTDGGTDGGGSGGGTGGGNSGKNKGTLIYADAVAGYTLMPRVNLEQGFASLGTLRERRGNMTCADCSISGNRHTWARAFGKHQKQDGKLRLNLDTDIYGLQIGHDFWAKQTANNGLNMLGAYLAYSHAATDFSDQYRARNGLIIADKKTGEGKSDSISLGLTNTYYGANGSYLDLVGQLSYLHNKYSARSGKNPDSQDGWGVAVSAEVGRTLPLRQSNWSVTPQAQLVYQLVDLDSFNDGIRHVDQNNQDALRGRVGLRLEYNAAGQAGQAASFYTVGNIWHDFINPSHVSIGRDSIREKFNTTWGEIGVGLQLPLARNSQLYGDVRYEHNFGSSKHQSFRGNIGLKVNW